MRRRGMGREEINAALKVTNRERCDPPLGEEEIAQVCDSVCRYTSAETQQREHSTRLERESQSAGWP
jgi:Primase C terminal 1 (PriCT-1)